MPSSDDDTNSLESGSGAVPVVEEGSIFCGISGWVEANRLGVKLNKSIDFERVK